SDTAGAVRASVSFGPGGLVSVRNVFAETLSSSNFSFGSGTLVNVRGSSTLTGSGPVLDLMDSALALTTPPVQISGGSTLRVGGGPALRMTGSATAETSFLSAPALVQTDGRANTVAVGGTLLDLTRSALALGALVVTPNSGEDTLAVALGSATPFIRMSDSSLFLGQREPLVTFLGDGLVPHPGVALVATGTPDIRSFIEI